MTPNDQARTFSPGQLGDALSDLATTSRPDYRDDLVQRLERTPQRPGWTFIERWLPMSVITARAPAASPMRATRVLLLIGLLTAAVVTSLVIVGSALLRDDGPDGLSAGLLVPTLELDESWDTTTIPGLSRPSGIDVGPDGNIYVVNAGADEILKLDHDGNVVHRWGGRGAGEGEFYFQQDSQVPTSTIGGVGVAPDGAVYVADTVNDRIQQFDDQGAFVRQFGSFGPADGQFLNPFDVAIDADGHVLVADLVRDDIQRFEPAGGHLQTIGGHGTGDGQLNNTGGLAVDTEGALYNADFDNDRLQSWAPDGTFRWSFGRDPSDGVRLTHPGDVAVDADGYIYVTEGDRLVVLGPDRSVASIWELPDDAKAEEWLPIAIGDDGTVYLSAETNGLIYRLRSARQESDIDPDYLEVARPPSPSAAAPEAAASPTPTAATAEGTFTVGAPFAVPFTAYRPAGWVPGSTTTGSTSMDLMRPGSSTYIQASVRVFVPTNAYADPCLSMEPMSPPVGPTVEDLTAVLTDLPGILVTQSAAAITIDGHQGQTFDLESTLISGECPAGAQWAPMWTYDEDGRETFAGPGDNFHQRIAILDVDGTRVLVEIWTFDDTAPVVIADAFRIFDSIDFS